MSADDWEADPDHTAGDTRCQSTGSTNIYFQSNTASYDDCVTFAESKGSLYMSYRDGSVCQNDVCNDGGGKWNCNAADVCGVKTSTYLPWTVYTRKTCDANVAPENGDVGDCTSTLASGKTCQPTCNTGYTVSGSSSCSAGTLTPATCTATQICTRTYEGGCGNWASLGLLNPWAYTDKTYTMQECHDLCKANSQCGGFFMATAANTALPGACLIFKAGCTDDDNAQWDYYDMS